MRNPRLLRTKADLDTPDDRWWQLQTEPPDLGRVGNDGSRVIVVFRQVDEGGAVVAHGSEPATTADVTIIPYALDNTATQAIQGGAEVLAGHDLSQPVTCEVPPGWSFAVWLGVVAEANQDAAGVQVWWDDYRP